LEEIIELREKFLNKEFDEKLFEIEPDTTIEFASLCGETSARFLDRTHPDFQTPPIYLCSLMGARTIPADFPNIGLGMDAGKGVEMLRSIRPGVTLTGRTHLHDIYEKTGRSGRMVFLVSRLELYDPNGSHVANSDTRIVMRERSGQ